MRKYAQINDYLYRTKSSYLFNYMGKGEFLKTKLLLYTYINENFKIKGIYLLQFLEINDIFTKPKDSEW